jgi:hypothetical protein
MYANRFYGRLPTSQATAPYGSHEPKPLEGLKIPVSTLKNPNSTNMWADPGKPMDKYEQIATIKGFSGWGIAK